MQASRLRKNRGEPRTHNAPQTVMPHPRSRGETIVATEPITERHPEADGDDGAPVFLFMERPAPESRRGEFGGC